MRPPLRGFTFIEVLVVVAIAAIAAALTYPAYSSASRGAKLAVSASNMRQLYVALALYRSAYDGDGRYGDRESMGLPDARWALLDRGGLPESLMQSPCGNHPSEQPSVLQVLYHPGDGEDPFTEWALVYRENLVVYSDLHCTPPSNALLNPYVTKTGVGVLLGGTIVRRAKLGDPYRPDWWAEPTY